MFLALEDNQVKLSTMKASRFVKAFETDVDHWERTLSHILEVVEMLLTVQRQWMYLEVSCLLNVLTKRFLSQLIFCIKGCFSYVVCMNTSHSIKLALT